jgi:hypothetical protein
LEVGKTGIMIFSNNILKKSILIFIYYTDAISTGLHTLRYHLKEHSVTNCFNQKDFPASLTHNRKTARTIKFWSSFSGSTAGFRKRPHSSGIHGTRKMFS